MHQFTGSYLPFPDTDSEAAMTGDPRASVLARYRGAGGYAEAIEAAARRLVKERLMLEEDVERVVARAQDWGRPLHDVRIRDARAAVERPLSLAGSQAHERDLG